MVISVKDLKDSKKKVEEAGGKIMGNIMDIPEIGKYFSFKDTEDNIVGVLQPNPRT